VATLTANIPVSTDLYTINATSYDTFALTFVDNETNRSMFPQCVVDFDFAAIAIPSDLQQWVTITFTQPATGGVQVRWAGGVRVDPGVSISQAASAATTVYAFSSTGRDWTVFPSGVSGAAADLSSQYGKYLDPAWGVDSSDPAIIAATTAAAQDLIDTYGLLPVPLGIFRVNTLTPVDGLRIVGHSSAGTTTDDDLRSSLRCTTGDLFATDGTVHYVHATDMELYCYGASTGDVLSGDWAFSRFERCSLIQGRADRSVVNVTTWIGCHMPGTTVTHVLTATVPTIKAVTSGGNINSSSLKEMVFVNNGDYAIWMEATGSAPLSLIDIENVIFENPKGGAIKLLSALDCNIDRVGMWDFTDPATAHLIVIGASTGPASKNNTINRYFRDATDAPGSGIKDISIQSGTTDTSVTKSSHQAVGSTITVDFNGTTGEYEPNSGAVFEDVSAARAIGDTGWRQISGMLGAGWSPEFNEASNRIRRIGNTVYVSAIIKNTSGSTKTANATTLIQPASGWGPGYTPVFNCPAVAALGAVETVVTAAMLGSLSNNTDIPNGSTIALTGEWTTNEAWPSSLPTAV